MSKNTRSLLIKAGVIFILLFFVFSIVIPIFTMYIR